MTKIVPPFPESDAQDYHHPSLGIYRRLAQSGSLVASISGTHELLSDRIGHRDLRIHVYSNSKDHKILNPSVSVVRIRRSDVHSRY